jgi:hypothetical protein
VESGEDELAAGDGVVEEVAGAGVGSLPVVDAAQEPPVGLGGGAAVGVGDDVVDLAAVGGGVATGGVLAVAVADFDGAA